jgi:cell division protein FtsW
MKSYVLGITWILVGIGLIETYGASALKADLIYNDSLYILKKQLAVALLGCIGIFFLQRIPYSWLRKSVPIWMGLSFVLLMGIFIPGFYTKAGGAWRWIRLGPIQYQPSELAKIALVFFLAWSLSRKDLDINSLKKGLLTHGGILGIYMGLLLLQPDFGTCLLIGGVSFAMFFVKGLSPKFILMTGGTGLFLVTLGILFKPYRMKRITAFLDPWADPQGSGFQMIQSYMALFNGGLLGLGLGESKQKLFYLPEAHTDFILAVIGEELGMVGVSFICLLFYFFVRTGFAISFQVKDLFGRYLAFGITCLIGMQSLFNIGVVLGLIPTKGISLPFISAGASSLITFMFLAGILGRIAQDIPCPDPLPGSRQAGVGPTPRGEPGFFGLWKRQRNLKN